MAQKVRRIAILHYAAPPVVGGVETTIGAHARYLDARGFRVRLLAGNKHDLGPTVEAGVAPEFGSRGLELDAVNRELNRGVISVDFENLVQRQESLLTENLVQCDLLIVHNALTLHKNLALTCALHRLHQAGRLPPLIAWCHDFAWTDPVYSADLHDGEPWQLIRTAWSGVRYVVVSASRQDQLASLLGLGRPDIHVINPGIDIRAFLKLEQRTTELVERTGLHRAEPLLLLPARITRRKNIELAIDILAALRDMVPNPKLVITAPLGPHNPSNVAYLESLYNHVKAARCEEEILFLSEYCRDADDSGDIPDSVVADLYRLADALLFPSSAEGFGIPLLEAGLSGLPIFCADIPVLREIAPRADLLFSLDDRPESIARGIAGVLATDTRYQLRHRVRSEYDWSTICQTYLLPLVNS